MLSPKSVSIIIPCFNRAGLIRRAIESASRDSPEAQIVVIDDGSSDDSWQVITSYEGIVRQRTGNRGVSAARNAGLKLASREFVRFLDSDDVFLEGSTAALCERWSPSKPTVLPVGRADRSGYGFEWRQNDEPISIDDLWRHTLPLASSIFSRDKLLELGGFDEDITVGEDRVLITRLGKAGIHFRQWDVKVFAVGDEASERLTRMSPSLLERQLRTAHRLASLASTEAERTALAQSLWGWARDASRIKAADPARELFLLSKQLASAASSRSPWILKMLYLCCSPFTAEQVLEAFKSLLRRRS